MAQEHVDVLIVGAGLSGVGAACHLTAELPGQDVRDPRGARRHRRHLGPVPLPRHPLGLGHVHARLLVPALERGQGDRRRAGDPELHPRDRARPRRGASRSASTTASCGAEWSTRGRALDRRGRAHRHRRDRARSPAASCSPAPATTATTRATRRTSRARERFRGRDRPPAALARGPRLRRQARRRDRQRRDGGHARPRDGGASGARDDAPALAELRRLAARPRTRSPRLLRRVLPAKAAYAIVRWKNVLLHDRLLQRSAAGGRDFMRRG